MGDSALEIKQAVKLTEGYSLLKVRADETAGWGLQLSALEDARCHLF